MLQMLNIMLEKLIRFLAKTFFLMFLIFMSVFVLQYLTYTGAVTFEKSYSQNIFRPFSTNENGSEVLAFALEGPPVTLTITGSLFGLFSRALLYFEDQFNNRSYLVLNSSKLTKSEITETRTNKFILDEIENNSEINSFKEEYVLNNFNRYCLETCNNINTSQKVKLIIKVLNGSIDISKIDYKI